MPYAQLRRADTDIIARKGNQPFRFVELQVDPYAHILALSRFSHLQEDVTVYGGMLAEQEER